MPGILPMKVIKVGTNAQTRIAQACDRCRSKKIRCDGIRPCCSQCANVGFECKTSDKLSRRAFPRGYTESLEERVRILEAEVRELKELLDEKDEKIDMLSRIHSQSSQPIRRPSPRRPSTTSVDASNDRDESPAKEELFKVQQSPNLLAGEGSDSYFSGTSSGRTFIEAFKQKVQETGRSTADINTDLLLASSLQKLSDSPPASSAPVVWKAPPRLLSDQLVNIFFQEWAPLFPVLHRPTFLTLYEKYVADSDTVTDTANIAQLNLVFGIASLSSGARESADLQSFEVQWKAAVDAILTENTMATLQALVLAQIFCVLQGDLTRLLTYKGLSTTLSARLGLQQSQKRFALGTLTAETRKKVFWTLYTVDSFTSVLLGLPKHLKDEDIHCEYPVDADDEYVTERGFQPTLPGESTKLSSALALFRLARILSKVLEEVFPAKATYDLSLKTLSDLSEELDAWSNSLAPHLRLQFAQDKPSTGTISSRSPLLSMAYHYIRALIQRPAICATLGSRSSSHMIAMASSCKHMVQIIQLLEERGMSFAFCLSKDEILVLCGFGLLFQGLGLDPASKILKDNQKTIHTIIGILKKTKAPCTSEFKRVALSFLPSPVAKQVAQPPRHQSAPQPSKREGQPSLLRHSSDPAITINPAPSLPASTKRQLKAIAARFTTNMKMPVLDASDHPNGAFFDNICMHPHGLPSQSTPSLQPSPICNPAPTARSEPARSPVNMYSRPPSALTRPSAPPQFQPKPKPKAKVKPKTHCQKYPNLDYLPLGDEAEQQNDWRATARTSQPVKPEPQPTDWEKLLGSLDNGTTNIYDACYGGPPIDALLDSPGLAMSHGNKSTTAVSDASLVWTADLWNLCQTETNTSNLSDSTTSSGSSGQTGSVLSLSTDDGKSSREDLTTVDWGPTSAPTIETPIGTAELFRGIVMPAGDLLVGEDVGFGSSSWDAAALGL